MLQQELFEELDALCGAYEKTLSLFDQLHESYDAGLLADFMRDEQIYYSLNFFKNGAHTQRSIPPATKEGARLICQLREKRVVIHGRRILRKNVRAIRSALKVLEVYEPEKYAGALTGKDPFPLPDRDFLPGQLNAGKWIRDTLEGHYKTNPFFPEHLRFQTRSGRLVRSKSEVFWDDDLTEAGALFRYDSEIRLQNRRVIYADFVVLHPREHRLVIIEHFGRMDDPEYAMKNLHRLQTYADSGYRLGRDVFFTMESAARPLTHAQIKAVMRQAGLSRTH